MRSTQLCIAICTYNRKDFLQKTLEALLRLNPAQASYEILVVNNNSTDNTADLLAEYAPKFHVSFRMVTETAQGLSHARNRALDESDAEFIAFLDDDALPCPGWVDLIVGGMTSVTPPPAIGGGKVIPRFTRKRPQWAIGERIDTFLFSAVDYGDESRWFANNEGPVGANIIYRKAVFDQYGIRFDPHLGRKGKGLWGGEEGEVLRQLRSHGENAYYIPDAQVIHLMSETRLSHSDARNRFYWMGRSHGMRSFFGRTCTTRDYWQSAVRFSKVWLKHLRPAGGDETRAMQHKLWRSYWTGMALQAWLCLAEFFFHTFRTTSGQPRKNDTGATR